jgi:hypothetical protein
LATPDAVLARQLLELLVRAVGMRAPVVARDLGHDLALVVREPDDVALADQVVAVLVVALVADERPDVVQQGRGLEQDAVLGVEAVQLLRLVEELQRERAHAVRVPFVELVLGAEGLAPRQARSRGGRPRGTPTSGRRRPRTAGRRAAPCAARARYRRARPCRAASTRQWRQDRVGAVGPEVEDLHPLGMREQREALDEVRERPERDRVDPRHALQLALLRDEVGERLDVAAGRDVAVDRALAEAVADA